jgi:hypothetical protein
MAWIVVVAVIGIATPEYFIDEVVGVEPSMV